MNRRSFLIGAAGLLGTTALGSVLAAPKQSWAHGQIGTIKGFEFFEKFYAPPTDLDDVRPLDVNMLAQAMTKLRSTSSSYMLITDNVEWLR